MLFSLQGLPFASGYRAGGRGHQPALSIFLREKETERAYELTEATTQLPDSSHRQ